MDTLISLGVIILIIGFATKRFAPKKWEEMISRFKK